MVGTSTFAIAVFASVVLIGEIIAYKTKGIISSMFFTSVVAIILVLTKAYDVMPLIKTSGFDVISALFFDVLMIDIGTMLDIKALKREWRTALVAVAACLAIVLACGTLGSLIIGKNLALAAIPPLTGGYWAAIIMSKGLAGTPAAALASFPILIFIIQGFVGFPITSIYLRKEGNRIVDLYKKGEYQFTGAPDMAASSDGKKKLCDRIPANLKTPAFYFAELFVLGVISAYVVKLIFVPLGINATLCQVLIGALAANLGLIDRMPLTAKSNSMGFIMLTFMTMTVPFFAGLTVSSILALLGKLLIIFAIATPAIMVTGYFVGKKMKLSGERGIMAALNCYLGFPFYFVLTKEASRLVAKDDEKLADAVFGDLVGTMAIGSIVSVTLFSVILASVLVSFLK